MLELLCKIPETGLAMMVGFLACALLMAWAVLGKCFVEMWKEHLEDLEAEKMEIE